MNESGASVNGRAAGEAAASTITDGNTDEGTYRHILKGIEDGDPEVLDIMPAPLSGEMAGESMIELLGEDYTDQDVEDYESAFTLGFWDEVERVCRYMTEDE